MLAAHLFASLHPLEQVGRIAINVVRVQLELGPKVVGAKVGQGLIGLRELIFTRDNVEQIAPDSAGEEEGSGHVV